MTHKNLSEASSLDYSECSVPPEGRMPKVNLMMAWWGVCSAIFYMVVAAAMARNYGTANALIGIVLTVIAYGVINSVISRYSIKTGLTVALFSKVLFGHFGAVVATLIFLATALYYAVFEGYVMALMLTEWSGNISMAASTAIVVVFSVGLIFGSVQHWLDKFNGVLLPVYVIGMLIAVGMAIAEFGYPSGWLTRVPEGGASPWGWAHTFAYYMGVWVLMMYTFDYARFGKKKDTAFHTRITFGIPFYAVAFLFSAIIGILLDSMIPTDGLSEASIVLGLLNLMGLGGLLLVWVTQSRINTANVYLATVNFQSFIGKISGVKTSKMVAGCVIGALAYVLMMADVFSYILQALAYQGVFVVAWVGIALAHILSRTYQGRFNGHVELNDDYIPAFNPCGLIAWCTAALTGIVIMNTPVIAGFSAPATFLCAYITYEIGLKFAKKSWYVGAA